MGLGILSCRSEKKFLKTTIKWRQIESKGEGSFERCTVSCGEGDINTERGTCNLSRILIYCSAINCPYLSSHLFLASCRPRESAHSLRHRRPWIA